MSAANIAALVSADVTASTGWTATATTTTTISSLQNAGDVSFDLTGSVGTASISATIAATTDLTALSTAINLESTNTGITATVSGERLP